ncbi:O-acetyl-ADP-ribose deacetylase [Marinobacterium jannaschii]|uniref:O-acetyl-ADP-ribose deacetylase n=1 Tax=Marinobacterium jannaschii TaxID=64970 RepID=UPI00047F722F|nr:O-acetyl-ADP-ribose deacetylase [Marinobacterium jannaschii]
MIRLGVWQGDITQLDVAVIVNAANSSLLGGGGVDGAIHRAAGPGLLQECRLLQGCSTGDVKVTSGHRLPAKYIVHAVGPVWHGGGQGEAELLASCYRHSIEAVLELGAESVAFPSISCGVYGYPHAEAVEVAVASVSDALEGCDRQLDVVFCCFNRAMTELYRSALKRRDAGRSA